MTTDEATNILIEAYVFDVRPVRPTENKPLALRLTFECALGDDADDALRLAKRLNDPCSLLVTFTATPTPDGRDDRQLDFVYPEREE